MFDALPYLPLNWIGPFLLRVSICTLIILMARRMLAQRWGAQIPRLLWFILIIRCLVPWTQPIPYHPAGLIEFESETVAVTPPSPNVELMAALPKPDRSIQARPDSPAGPDTGPVMQGATPYGPRIIVGLWISGVLAVLILSQVHNRRIVGRALNHALVVPAWVQEILMSCRDQLGMRQYPELVISPHVSSPCLAGALRPRILLPSTLLQGTTQSEMHHILLHECIHLQQRDIWYAWLWTITLALHWFNPLLWWAGRRLSQDCEAACDERVLAVLDPDKRISYGQSLLALAQRLRPTAKIQPGFVCIIEHTSRIERRLTMIKNYHKRKVPTLGILALILFAVLVLTSYAAQQAKPPDSEKAELMGRVEKLFRNKFKDVSMRKSLEWDLLKSDDHRHRSIRYKYEALFSDQQRRTMNQIFTYDVNGNYVGHETLEPASRGKMHPLAGNFVTVHQDGGPSWEQARAIKENTWFVGHFSRRRDERWYKLEVSADVTYAFFVDDENGSGKYSADPAFEIYEQRVDRSTRVVLDRRGLYYSLPLGYRPQRNCTAYICIVSHNPRTTSFAFGYTEYPRKGKASGCDILMGLPSILFEDGKSARFLFEDNGLDYQPISTPTEFADKDFKLTFLGLAQDDTSFYIKLAYDSPKFSRIGVRLAGDLYGLKQFLPVGTRKGKNLLIIQLETRKVVAYPTHICVEIGDGHSVVIEKDIVHEFLSGTMGSVQEGASQESPRFSFKDNGLDYQPISTPARFQNKDFKLSFLGLAKDDTSLYIKLDYDSPRKSRVGVRLAGDAPGLRKFLSHGTEIGKNLLIIQLDINKVAMYPTHICVEIGDDHSTVIQKNIVDHFLSSPRGAVTEQAFLESAGFSFKDNGLDYQPISTPTGFRNKDFKLKFLGLAKNNTFMYIKLDYVSPIEARVGVRLAGDKDISDAHGVFGYLPYGTKVGENLLILKQDLKKVEKYPTHICVEIGDDKSVVIRKDVVDKFLGN